jgi:[acyl-carrier-protein] S-malonyltransferase
LTRTVHLQPAVTAVNLSFLACLTREGVAADASAGHSLGEYSALHAAGVVSAPDTIRLVHKRGELMHRESLKHRGAMHAVIGLSIDTVQELVNEHRDEGAVSVANHNTETQIVITGSPEMVERVSERARGLGAKTVALNVSGAWHSELIQGSVEPFQEFISGIELHPPRIPILLNVTAEPAEDPEQVRSVMAQQLCRPVRWFESVRRLVEEGVTAFVEVGPGRVLTGLVKKIVPPDSPVTVHAVGDMKGLERFLSEIA